MDVTERANYGEDLLTELQNKVSRYTFKGHGIIDIVTGLSIRNFMPYTFQSSIMMHGLHFNALVVYSAIIGSSATVTN